MCCRIIIKDNLLNEHPVCPPSYLTSKEEIYDYIRIACENAIRSHHKLFFDIHPDICQKIECWEVLEFCSVIVTQHIHSCSSDSRWHSSPSPVSNESSSEDTNPSDSD